MYENPIDQTILEGLDLIQRKGRPDLPKTVVMLFLESAPTALKELQTGAAQNDAALLRQASHVLRSSSVAVGPVRLSAQCKLLESTARSGVVPDAAAQIKEILRLYGQADSVLRAWCAGRG